MLTQRIFPLLLILAPILSPADSRVPLVIKDQGSFYIGGEKKEITPMVGFGNSRSEKGDITVNQMYVQYQLPKSDRDYTPIVMIHGCCLSSKTWETTPDGRPGWKDYFLRQGKSVYLAEQVSRGRSGFDPSPYIDVREGRMAAERMPYILSATYQFAWLVFRFGPKFGEAFPDQQFPMHSVDELYKQMIPDLSYALLQNPNPTWTHLATLGERLGGAVMIGHSQGGFFPERAALMAPKSVKGIVSIEPNCETNMSPTELETLSTVPVLILFGDHLGDVTLPMGPGKVTWEDALKPCKVFIKQLKRIGGKAELMYLPEMGIRGNSHMVMQDRNSDLIASLVETWIEDNVHSASSSGAE